MAEINLSKYGITGTTEVVYNPSYEMLFEEETKSLYIEAKSDVDARQRVEENTPYNIEFVQLLEGSHLEYEKENADFSLVEF